MICELCRYSIIIWAKAQARRRWMKADQIAWDARVDALAARYRDISLFTEPSEGDPIFHKNIT